MPKSRKTTTDLSALLGTASRSSQIQRPRTIETEAPDHRATPVSSNITTPTHPTAPGSPPAEAAQERRINVAIRESIHKPLKLHAVKTDREVRDIVELALRRYLESHGEI